MSACNSKENTEKAINRVLDAENEPSLTGDLITLLKNDGDVYRKLQRSFK